jgi:hypothetical protein
MSLFKDDEEIARELYIAELALQEQHLKQNRNYATETMDANLARYYALEEQHLKRNRNYAMETMDANSARYYAEQHLKQTRNYETETMDADLARYYARLYLEQQQQSISSQHVAASKSETQSVTNGSGDSFQSHLMRKPAASTQYNNHHESRSAAYSDPYLQEQHSFPPGIDYSQQSKYPSVAATFPSRQFPPQMSPEYDRYRNLDLASKLKRLEEIRLLDINSSAGYNASGILESTRTRTENEVDNPEPRRMATTKEFEYDRILQEQAFINQLRQSPESFGGPGRNLMLSQAQGYARHSAVRPEEYNGRGNSMIPNNDTNFRSNDEIIARKLQDLEIQRLRILGHGSNMNFETRPQQGINFYGHDPLQISGIQSGLHHDFINYQAENNARLALLKQDARCIQSPREVASSQSPLTIHTKQVESERHRISHLDSPRKSVSAPPTQLSPSKSNVQCDVANTVVASIDESTSRRQSGNEESVNSLSSSVKSTPILSPRADTPSESSATLPRSPLASFLQSSSSIQKSKKSDTEKMGSGTPTPGSLKKKGLMGFIQQPRKDSVKEPPPRKAPSAPLSSFYGSSQATKSSNSSNKNSSMSKPGSTRSSGSFSSASKS